MQHEAYSILYFTSRLGSKLMTFGIIFMSVVIQMTSSLNKSIQQVMKIKTAITWCQFMLGQFSIQVSYFMNAPQWEAFLVFMVLIIVTMFPINNLSNDMIDCVVNQYLEAGIYTEQELKDKLDQENFSKWDYTLRYIPAIFGNIIWGYI